MWVLSLFGAGASPFCGEGTAEAGMELTGTWSTVQLRPQLACEVGYSGPLSLILSENSPKAQGLLHLLTEVRNPLRGIRSLVTLPLPHTH
jgi:hypothetical protein